MGLTFKKIYIDKIYTCLCLYPPLNTQHPNTRAWQTVCLQTWQAAEVCAGPKLPHFPWSFPKKHGLYLCCASFIFIISTQDSWAGGELSNLLTER